MSPSLVVDIGNTRIKWGRCVADTVVESAALPPDDTNAWQSQLDRWSMAGPLVWAIADVQPRRRERLLEWLRRRGDSACVLASWQQLPLRVLLEQPQRVGIDRLLDAVAVNSRRPVGVPAVIIDAGSAVTVDWVDENGAFGGGAILPGLRLMAKALHEHTALLPLIDVPGAIPPLPGTSTSAALEAGIFWAVAGGIQALIGQLAAQTRIRPQVFLTGGDAGLLHAVLGADVFLWPHMTLEGIRLTSETLA